MSQESANKIEEEKILQIAEKRNKTEYEWIKQALVVISTLLGLIIALKSKDSQSHEEHIAFVVTIISNATCLLVGLIFLHRETDVYHGLLLKYYEHKNDFLGKKTSTYIEYAPKRIYQILKAIFFISLFASIISLVIYGIISDLPK